MYKKSFYIEKPVWNNAFSFERRQNKRIFVPNLVEISDFSEINIWNEIAFEDFDFSWNLIKAKWLKNFYKIKWKNKNIYLFDNHNHAYYFWYLSRSEWIIWNNNILYHIDEHTDSRVPEKIISKEDAKDLNKVFEYTNFCLDVWNYIVPALKEGIISEIIMLRSENDLINFNSNNVKENIILNLDLDFFEPNLDYIDYNLKKKVILNIAKKAKVITVATSPFFIDQEVAIKVFKDLFFNS